MDYKNYSCLLSHFIFFSFNASLSIQKLRLQCRRVSVFTLMCHILCSARSHCIFVSIENDAFDCIEHFSIRKCLIKKFFKDFHILHTQQIELSWWFVRIFAYCGGFFTGIRFGQFLAAFEKLSRPIRFLFSTSRKINHPMNVIRSKNMSLVS